MSNNPNHRVVMLRNGTEELYQLVVLVMAMLRKFGACEDFEPGQPFPSVVIYELVAKARDRDHQVFSIAIGEVLAACRLFDNTEGAMHNSTRNIIVSAFDGSELEDLRLINPLHESELKTTQALHPRDTE